MGSDLMASDTRLPLSLSHCLTHTYVLFAFVSVKYKKQRVYPKTNLEIIIIFKVKKKII